MGEPSQITSTQPILQKPCLQDPHGPGSHDRAQDDLAIQGTLASVDQFLNLKLENIKMAVKNCFIRGSVVRYVQIPRAAVDTQLLEDATRKEAANTAKR
ncbi:hypothetical protein PCASD_24821 [Puccinia coronata f. sp. avenae]|uniref:Sm domain-containing protein n=1 Tax=Puccinia coronata f. sp. avenae TaxID=200324 RepID=A0A2N5RWC5_9BASI|nr:hypothetical protein PCASD_24821 [Puccinia coronata f. sp. avenae]